MGIIPDYPGGPSRITQVLKIGELFLAVVRGEEVSREANSERCHIASFEDRGREPLKAGKGKEWILP
jgi:hypothetical protein